jgi:hypothetical protein
LCFDGFRSRDVQRNIYQKYWNEMKKKHPDLTDDQLKARVGVFAGVVGFGIIMMGYLFTMLFESV